MGFNAKLGGAAQDPRERLVVFEIEYFESADPLVRLLQSDPSSVFGRPYAGYLIFLFGSADVETSGWIRANLAALDSLTGPDIAGVIFAKAATVQVSVETHLSRRPWRHRGRGEPIRALDIRHRPELERHFEVQQILSDGFSPMDAPVRFHEENVLATTYAADEVARALHLVGEIPCIAVIDGVPGQSIEVISLDAVRLPTVIQTLRRAIGRFYESARPLNMVEVLRNLQRMSERLTEVERCIGSLGHRLEIEMDKVDSSLANRLRAAKARLMEGSARRFIRQLSQIGQLPVGLTLRVSESATANSQRLNVLAKTVFSLKRCLSQPLTSEERTSRLKRIFDHVRPIEGMGEVSHLDPQRALEALERQQSELVSVVWGELPSPEQLDLSRELECRRISARFQAEGEELQAEQERLLILTDSMSRELAAVNVSFLAALRDTQQSPDLHSHSATVPKQASDLVLGFLSPGIREKIRDIYIGVGVGAMGPGATVGTVAFDQ